MANVTATALDDQQVVKVDLWVDNELRLVDDTAPYKWSWNTANELNGDHTLELRALDIAGRVATSELRTVRVNNSAPTVALLSPMWDRVFTGLPLRIRWIAADGAAPIAAFRIDVSSDGKTFRSLAGCEVLPSTARECLWNAPGPASNRSAVRITAIDALGASVARTSPTFKILTGATTLTMRYPDKPTALGIGSTQSVFWSTDLGLSPLNVELSLDGGLSWGALASPLLPLNGDLRWTMSGPATSRGLIRVSSMNTSLQDVSDAVFTIAPSSLALRLPIANTVWRHHSQAQVKWATNLGAYDRLNVRLSIDGGTTFPIVLAGSVDAKRGVAKVIVPALTTDTARVMLESLANPAWRAVGANFKIMPP
jgi:Bacterial Ig domain